MLADCNYTPVWDSFLKGPILDPFSFFFSITQSPVDDKLSLKKKKKESFSSAKRPNVEQAEEAQDGLLCWC